MATCHRLSKHEDLEIWTNADSHSETDLEEDFDLDETDDSASTDIDELSYENFPQTGSFTAGYCLSSTNRIDPGRFFTIPIFVRFLAIRNNSTFTLYPTSQSYQFFSTFFDRNLIEAIVS